MVANTRSSNNEKILRFSKGLVLENGSYLINMKDDVVLNRYKWWKGLTKPKDTFNPRKTKGFLVLKLFLYGYLNRISTYRSNKDNDLMHPYLKILLNNVEVYRTKVLDSSINIWEEKIEIEIHYIKSKIEIQLFDMDETEGIVEDEFIGSALIDITYLELSKKYDIILKYMNKMAILLDPYRYKKEQKDHFDMHTSEHMSGGYTENMSFNPTHHDRDKSNSKKKVVLSLLFFILVSIIRESDQIKKGNKFTGCTQEETKSKKKNNNSSFIYWTQAKQLGGYRMNHAEEYLIGNSLKEGDHLGNSAVPSCSGSDNNSGSGDESESGTKSDSGSSDISGSSSSSDSFSLDDVSTDQSVDPPNHRSDIESSVCNNSGQEELNWKDVVRGRKKKGDVGDSRRGKTKEAVSNVTDEGSKTGKKKRPNGHSSIRGRNSNNEENGSTLNYTDEYNKNNGTSASACASANAKVNHDVSPHGNSDSNNTTYTNAHCNHSTEVDTEINLSVIKTFVANVIDDDIINNEYYFLEMKRRKVDIYSSL
ncbi:conserved Plasmodium protein, unknown function [Plasmodium ovale wallikeri]|uniref:C2 domain-containing protein n=1 Tax=Plasmodium ovale wallikeri TaxID=864142 RepID=A0A1A8YUP3_PLAOA|nr:conserved Plasmodium protein, unknown function [Plasmodium ovale wallikeri]SBT35390.1 conserved Plasmodium protein, unknown function [Plasmodium ovale wallikeri]